MQLIEPMAGDRWSDLDVLVADPSVVERYGRPRKEKSANRVLEILDQLERGKA